ncbi:MAG TPA: ATP-grasp domain-containing protein, partial [Candidatus Binatia bacterium]|nr:ATP-grasp domain-containing protein [Candidatus Binatia bacterium]
MTPTVLLSTTERWYPTARMAMALADAGCAVDVLCPPGHPVAKTSALRRMHHYNGIMPLRSIARAIPDSGATLVVPGDDLAAIQLHQLYHSEVHRRRSVGHICEVIERSLGSPAGFDLVHARSDFMRMAREEGVRVPETAVIKDISDLQKWSERIGFPCVLKANGTSGGDGVQVATSIAEAEQAFRRLGSPPVIARAVKRAMVDRDLTLLGPSFFRRGHIVNAQAFIKGHEATSAIVCWKGVVLASLHFEVLEKMHSTGHATVVRLIEHREMTLAAERIARRLNLSGFHGLDFILEASSSNAYLIEINPRTTQVGHLALGPGRNLPAALYAAITGKNSETSAKVTERDTI